jgi:hypothetical protein
MGLNICVIKDDNTEYSGWDAVRRPGDREFAEMIKSLPFERGPLGRDSAAEQFYRPTNFGAWRTAIANGDWPDRSRFERLIDILEANPSYYLCLSY